MIISISKKSKCAQSIAQRGAEMLVLLLLVLCEYLALSPHLIPRSNNETLVSSGEQISHGYQHSRQKRYFFSHSSVRGFSCAQLLLKMSQHAGNPLQSLDLLAANWQGRRC